MKRLLPAFKSIIATALAIIFLGSALTYSKETRQVTTENLSKYFSGYSGCFVMLDKSSDKYTIYNKKMSRTRFSPFSTFGIYDTMIGLETGVIKDENTTFTWNGSHYFFPSWDKNQTLASAMENSVIWCYQEIASMVGYDKIQDWIDKIGYGNKDASGSEKRFWIQSSLKISPAEQVALLDKLYSYNLPFKKRNVDILKNIMIISKNKDTILSGTTGSAPDDTAGWFVGCVKKAENYYFFSTYIQGNDNIDGQDASQIALKILKDKDII